MTKSLTGVVGDMDICESLFSEHLLELLGRGPHLLKTRDSRATAFELFLKPLQAALAGSRTYTVDVDRGYREHGYKTSRSEAGTSFSRTNGDVLTYQLGHCLLEVLIDGGKEVLRGEPWLIWTDQHCEVLGHLAFFDCLNADALESLSERSDFRSAIHATAV